MISFMLIVALFSACIGSFLNVVIYRLPIMMQREWKTECALLLNLPPPEKETFNLFIPRSHCPHCKYLISFFVNIPILGFFILKGRCSHCHKKISPRYLIIEISCVLLSLTVASLYGWTLTTLAALIFTWTILPLIAIDLEHQLLPDQLTFLLLWAGLFFSLFNVFISPAEAILGAISGYLLLWIVAQTFFYVTGKEGMGYGDFKLFAALGAWFGWSLLPLILFFASFCGAFVGISLMLLKKAGRETPIAFGPYLAAAGWLTLIFKSSLSHFYFYWLG